MGKVNGGSGARAISGPLAWKGKSEPSGTSLDSLNLITIAILTLQGYYGYALIGTVANLAARLCAIAEDGQIVLSERAFARVEGEIEGSSIGAVELKGFRRPVVA